MERQDPVPQSRDTCGECRHAIANGVELSSRLCNRYPPAVFPMQHGHAIAGVSMRPQVKSSDAACGEFLRRRLHDAGS